jgi:dTDP-4-dehydrorhamnose reductase
MSTILITGANGQLGSEFRGISVAYPEYKFIFTDIEQLDITCEFAVSEFFYNNKPDIIINCAAYTAVDKAETDVENAFKINAEAPGLLARFSQESGAFLFHISTDFVFDGNRCTPYNEIDNTNPVSIYGQSKRKGELEVISNTQDYIILRTSWLYSAYGRNFVKTIISHAKEKGQLRVVYDQIGTPTYAFNLAMIIMKIISAGDYMSHTGLYHYSDEGVTSWYDFACAITDIAGIKCKTEAILSHSYPTSTLRPHYSVLDKSKIKQEFGFEIPFWLHSLRKCIHSLNSGVI